MPEPYAVFFMSLGEVEQLVTALAGGEPELAADVAERFVEILDPDDDAPALLSVAEMLELGEHIEAAYGLPIRDPWKLAQTGAGPTHSPVEAKAIRDTEAAQERFMATVRKVARDCGYAIAVHGSEMRDLDLVAVPWAVEAVGAQDLVDALCAIVPLVVRTERWPIRPSPEEKPWGRLAWSLHGCPAHKYVDLSVAPRAGEAVPVVHYVPSGACGRVLVGRGGDTSDPLCTLNAGHEGPCRP